MARALQNIVTSSAREPPRKQESLSTMLRLLILIAGWSVLLPAVAEREGLESLMPVLDELKIFILP
jgi:hypothetical protein